MLKRPTISVGVIIRKDNRVLLLRRKGPHGSGIWSVPFSPLEFWEQPEEAAARAAYEEVGVRLSEFRFRGLTNDIYETTGRHSVTIWIEAHHLSGEPIINYEERVDSLEWFVWGRLPKPLALSLENLVAGRCYPQQAVFPQGTD
jgi:8-oxo-dGTP diphosphatase